MYTSLAISRLEREIITPVYQFRASRPTRRYASRAFACARARPTLFKTMYNQHQPERTSLTPYVCSSFKRFLAPPPRLPYPVSVSRYRLPLSPTTYQFPRLCIYIYIYILLSLSPPIFFSSSQRRFFRTHTPPRINNSPYEFTRKRTSGRTGESANGDTSTSVRTGWRTSD